MLACWPHGTALVWFVGNGLDRSAAGRKGALRPYCVCRGDHWSPANLPQQRIFRDSFLQGKRARASNARPYKRFSTV